MIPTAICILYWLWQVLVLTGNPAHRPPLVDFANLITKKLSLLVCGHVITEPGSVHLATLKESTQRWLTDRKIKVGVLQCTAT